MKLPLSFQKTPSLVARICGLLGMPSASECEISHDSDAQKEKSPWEGEKVFLIDGSITHDVESNKDGRPQLNHTRQMYRRWSLSFQI